VRRTVANLVLVVAGLLIMVYPLTVGAASELSCRGVVMQPGDACAKADGSSSQTYEQRARARRNAVPIIMVVGLGVAGFGLTLLIMERRRPQRSKTVAS
jgi:hypothetical protein